MQASHLSDDFDLYLVRNFFDAEVCCKLIDEMRDAPATPTTTYGHTANGAVNERVRKAMRVMPSPDTINLAVEKLDRHRQEIGEHFNISLGTVEDPQFLRYRTGDFFVAHQDGNTGLLQLDSDRLRRISVSIFLNHQSQLSEVHAYGGGSLVFSDWRRGAKFEFNGEAGTLIAFRSEITHEVIPITHGERYSIVSWFRVP